MAAAPRAVIPTGVHRRLVSLMIRASTGKAVILMAQAILPATG